MTNGIGGVNRITLNAELAAPPALVARVESLEAIGRARREIGSHYSEALGAREKGIRAGLIIGRMLLQASLDREVRAAVLKHNSDPANPGKLRPGSPVRVYCWAAREIARGSSYTPAYLEDCAREYLALANQRLAATGEKPLALSEGGVFPEIRENPHLPTTNDCQPYLKLPNQPVMESTTAEPETETPTPTPTPDDIARAVARPFFRAFQDEQGHVRLARREREAVIKRVNMLLGPLGFEIMAVGR